jgi:hypothetical protein
LFITQFLVYFLPFLVFLIPAETRWLSLLIFGPASLFAYRLISSARVSFESDGVVVTNFRRRKIMWEQLADVGITRGSSAFSIAWRVPFFELRDGTLICAQHVRSRREGTVVDAVVAEARDWLRRH